MRQLIITAAAVALVGCGASQVGGPSLANASGDSPLYEAVGSPDSAVARLLLAKGADANQRNQFGRTPLHRALTKTGSRPCGCSWPTARM
jgi:ankyrin repeat protein